MGVGYASGDGRAVAAARGAISSPLLEASIEGARGILLNVSGPSDLGLFELNEAAEIIGEAAHPDANIIFGAVIDDALGDEVRITVIAAGFDRFEGEQRGNRSFDTVENALGLDDEDSLAGDDALESRRRRLRRARVPALSDDPAAPSRPAGDGADLVQRSGRRRLTRTVRELQRRNPRRRRARGRRAEPRARRGGRRPRRSECMGLARSGARFRRAQARRAGRPGATAPRRRRSRSPTRR